MGEQQTTTKHYFYSIDGLRIIAAVNIILFHFEISGGLTSLHGYPGWLFMLVKGPAFHASLFFILGGFIYMTKSAHHAATFSTVKFLRKRLKDLYLLHLFATLIMAVLLFFTEKTVCLAKLGISIVVHGGLLWSLFPFNTYSLNTPSWALSAFFFCYLFFGPMMRFFITFQRKRQIVTMMVLFLVPSLVWAFIFSLSGYDKHYYTFFHVFAPIRFCEFCLGMLAARLFQVRGGATEQTMSKPVQFSINDLYIIAIGAGIWGVLYLRRYFADSYQWISYHTIMPALYCFLLYRFARGNGMIASFFAIDWIRRLGKSSFYPYLLHIPLISWICFVAERFFHYRTLLHSPVNIALFIVFLYYGSSWYTRLNKRQHVVFVEKRGTSGTDG